MFKESEKQFHCDIPFSVGWISPSGKGYSCEYGEELQLAEDIVYDVYHESIIINAKSFLENKGWKQISYDAHMDLYIVGTRHLNHYQIKFMLDSGLYCYPRIRGIVDSNLSEVG